MFPELFSFEHLRPSALGLALARHAQRQPWRWRADGREIMPSEAFARDGWLPALMAGAAWELQIPWDELVKERFCTYNEPSPWYLACGFYLASDPCPMTWAFPIWRHVSAHEHQGWVELDCSVNAWLEGLKGSPKALDLHWQDLPEPKVPLHA